MYTLNLRSGQQGGGKSQAAKTFPQAFVAELRQELEREGVDIKPELFDELSEVEFDLAEIDSALPNGQLLGAGRTGFCLNALCGGRVDSKIM